MEKAAVGAGVSPRELFSAAPRIEYALGRIGALSKWNKPWYSVMLRIFRSNRAKSGL
jgi:hypothetical protein